MKKRKAKIIVMDDLYDPKEEKLSAVKRKALICWFYDRLISLKKGKTLIMTSSSIKESKTKNVKGKIMKKLKISKADTKRGTKHEMEHTKSKKVAKKIAMDHEKEHPLYYNK